jgi:hypothetical protein
VGPRNSGLRTDHYLSQWSGLEEFLKEFVETLPVILARFVHAYVGGQLTARSRKTLHRLASEAGVSVTYMVKLLRDPRWEEERIRSLLCSRVRRFHGKQLRGVIFEETCQKSGQAFPGVDVQYSEDKGKPLRSLSLTHLVLADQDFCCLLGTEPYLPESWLKDDRRRAAAGIPWHQSYRPKWKCAIELVRWAREHGVRFDWLLLDRSYGGETALLQALSEDGDRFVAEVPESLKGWLSHPFVATGKTYHLEPLPFTGAPTVISRPARPMKELTAGIPLSEEPASEGAGKVETAPRWKARILPFFAENNGLPSASLGLLILRNPTSGDCRYFVSNGFLGIDLKTLTELALSEDVIEGSCRNSARHIGLADFQVRNYATFRRHLALSSLSILFHAERTGTPSTLPLSKESSG